jgi:hypothetical protein
MERPRVLHWFGQAACVPGLTGFAVGRTLWWNELVACVRGEIGRVVPLPIVEQGAVNRTMRSGRARFPSAPAEAMLAL